MKLSRRDLLFGRLARRLRSLDAPSAAAVERGVVLQSPRDPTAPPTHAPDEAPPPWMIERSRS